MKLVHGDECLAVVAEDELKVEQSLDTCEDHIEDRAFTPSWKLTQQRDHPCPVQNDGEPLVAASFNAVTIDKDIVAADRDHDWH